MGSTINESKQGQRKALRQQVLAARDSLTPTEITNDSFSIAARLLEMVEIVQAGTVLSYMHFRSEVQTAEIIHRLLSGGKKVCIPYTKVDTSELVAVGVTDLDQQVVPGYCGIPEPTREQRDRALCEPGTIDVVTIPGSVFDKTGGRLGYGGGFYDRFLSNKSPEAIRVALAFELQLVDSVPVESHDQVMDYVVTENNIYDCRRYRYA